MDHVYHKYKEEMLNLFFWDLRKGHEGSIIKALKIALVIGLEEKGNEVIKQKIPEEF